MRADGPRSGRAACAGRKPDDQIATKARASRRHDQATICGAGER